MQSYLCFYKKIIIEVGHNIVLQRHTSLTVTDKI